MNIITGLSVDTVYRLTKSGVSNVVPSGTRSPAGLF